MILSGLARVARDDCKLTASCGSLRQYQLEEADADNTNIVTQYSFCVASSTAIVETLEWVVEVLSSACNSASTIAINKTIGRFPATSIPYIQVSNVPSEGQSFLPQFTSRTDTSFPTEHTVQCPHPTMSPVRPPDCASPSSKAVPVTHKRHR